MSKAKPFDGAAFLAAKVKESADLIGPLRAEEEMVRAELNRLNIRLKELTASIASAEEDQANYQLILDQLSSGQTPPADPEPAKVRGVRSRQPRARKVTAPTAAGGRRRAPVSNAILGLLGGAPDQEWSVKELQARLPEVGPKVLSNTVLRLHARGSIDRTRAGHYRLASSVS